MGNHPEMLIDELQQLKGLQSKLLLANELLKMIRRNADYYAIPPYIVNCINHTIERIEE
jgi:hypothetical protein